MQWIQFLYRWFPFLPDSHTYFVPWVQFRNPEGDLAEGPMLRQGTARREILTWTNRGKAEDAARQLVAQTGGKFEIRTLDRRAVQAQCRQYSAWGSRVVAVILK